MSPKAFPFAAVIVTYNPEPEVLGALLGALDHQECSYVIVDNHSGNVSAIRAISATHSRCLAFEAQAENVGLAAALNIGIEYVRSLGFHQVLLFDQDSGIPDGFCSGMASAMTRAQGAFPHRVAAIGPRVEDPDTGRATPFRRFDTWWPAPERSAREDLGLIETGFLITSGTLIVLAALDDIGGMLDKYFIDNIDLEWCFRALHQGYRIFGVDQPRLLHRIGERSRNPLVKSGVVVKHSPLRYYYSTRNRIHLHRQAHAPWAWRFRDTIRFVLKTSYLLATSSQRTAFFASLRRAMRDGKTL